MFNLSEKNSFLAKYYLLLFCRGFIFLKHYLVILLDNTLNPIETSFVVSVGIMANMFLSVPISILSSKIGNKKTFIISIIFFFLSNILLLYEANFIDFIIYSISAGILDSAFLSSNESLVYENMKHCHLLNKYPEYKSMSKFFKLLATTIATFIAGDLIYTNPNLLFMVDATTAFLMILCVFFMIDLKPKYKRINFKKITGYVFKHKTLMKCILHRVLWRSVFLFLIIYRSLFYEELAVNDMNINLMISFQVFIVSISQIVLTKYLNKKSLFVQYYLFILLSFILFLSFFIYKTFYSYFLITIYFILVEALGDLSLSNTLAFIPDKEMPIILSFMNLLVNGAKLLFVNLFAFISSFYNYRIGFLTISMIFFILMLFIVISIALDKHMRNIDNRRLYRQ